MPRKNYNPRVRLRGADRAKPPALPQKMLKNLTRSVALAASLAIAEAIAAAGFSAIRGADETPDPATVTAVEAGGAGELRTGAERLISTEAGGEIGDRGAIATADLPVGFHKILAEKNGRTDALRFFVLPPPPGNMPAAGVRTDFAAVKKTELFTVVRADIDTLSQISVKFQKVVDPAALAATGTFLLTDLDAVEKSVTDSPEITGAAWDPEAGTLTLGVRGMTAQPGEEFALKIRGGPTVRMTQPDEKWLDFKLAELENLALAAEEDARAAAAAEPEILSGAVVETPNQIRLPIPANLPASGILLAENWFLPAGADFRGAGGDGADLILAVAGLPAEPGTPIEIGFGTGAGALRWPAVMPDFSALGVAVVETGSGETASGAELFVDEIRPAAGTGETVETAGSGATAGTDSGENLATGTGEISEKSGTSVAAGTGETADEKTGSGEILTEKSSEPAGEKSAETGTGAAAGNPAGGSGAETENPRRSESANAGEEPAGNFQKDPSPPAADQDDEIFGTGSAADENLTGENPADPTAGETPAAVPEDTPTQNSVVSSEAEGGVEKPAGGSGEVSPLASGSVPQSGTAASLGSDEQSSSGLTHGGRDDGGDLTPATEEISSAGSAEPATPTDENSGAVPAENFETPGGSAENLTAEPAAPTDGNLTENPADPAPAENPAPAAPTDSDANSQTPAAQ